MAMEEEEEDVGRALLNRFHNSPAPEHKQLLAVVSAVMEVLKEQGLPLIPTAYFAATMAPLEQQCNAGAVDGADTTAFLTFLATLLPKLPASVLRSTSGKALVVLDKVLGDAKLPAATAKPALSCIECILCAADRSSWPALAGSFQLLLKFCVDMRPKVRRRAYLCAAQVLSSFHGSAALDKASDLVASSFEECASPFLAKGKSNEDAAAGALKLLHMIGAMRLLLPAMSPKTIARVLPSVTLLITLKQSLVTRNVLNVLLSLGRRSRTGVSSAALVGVIRAVLSLVTADNRDVDEVMTAVHVIEQGLSNLYAIDPKLCAGQLPAPFDAITDLFASEQEEVVFGAAECLRGLADRFIDGAMLRQLETDPVAIESICSSVERSLSYEYSGAWDKALLVVSALFQKMGEASFRFMKGIVKVLAELQKLRDEDLPCRKQLHNSFGAAVVAMGPERFLELLPLDMDATQLDKARIWLIPILKQHLVGARLKYFATTIGPLAENLAVKAHELSGAPAKNAEACAQALWALLPSFCNYPVDTKDSFQVIAKLLGESMRKYPDLRGVISSSIQTLIKQNKSICDANDGMDVDLDAKEKACYSKDIASANLSAISAFSDKFLPLLFNIFCESPPEKRGELQAAIGAFASISSKATVQKFFRTVMEKLLEATKDTNAKERRCMFMDLALSLVGGLDHKGLSALFAVAKPALQDPDSGVQKKGYKVLAGILKEHTDFLSSKEQEIFEVIVEATSACQSSAKQYRVACLQLLILHLVQGDENTNDYIAFLLKESVLALKENNKKTRDGAYELLIGIGNGLLQVSDEKLVQFFRKLVGCSAVTGSAGEPHVISAALSAISRMVYEFPAELKGEIHRYLPSAFYLLRNYKSREVIKSVLGLLKVIVAMMSKEELMPRLSEMVEAMMVWSEDPKNRFKAKVRGILEKLLKKCGFEAVSAVMPKEHAKHLVNIRKRKDHEEKKKRSIIDGEDDKRSHFTRATTTRRSKWKHTDIFSDSDEDNDGDDESEGATAFTRSKATTARSKKLPKQKRRLPEDERGRDEPLDLLDVSKTRAALSTLGKPKKSQAESDEDMDFDPDGRLIVEERQPQQQQQQGRASKRPRDEEEEGEEEEFGRSKKGAKKRGKVAAENQKKRSTGWSYKGDEYVNKKGAGGDVKRDGKLEPYAYWPLDAKLLNRRGEKKAAARKGMESVFKVTKKLEGLSVNKALGGIQKKRKKQHNKAHKSGANSKSARSKR